MGEDNGNRGVWAGLIVAAVAAVVFLVLWVMRGGEMDRLSADLDASRATASRAAQRLEDDLQSARRDAATASGKVAELETRLRDDASRAADSASRIERGLRDEVRRAEERLAEAEERLAEAEKEFAGHRELLADQAGKETVALRAELEKAGEELAAVRESGRDELDRLNRELRDSRKSIDELRAKLAASVPGKEAAALRAGLEKAGEELAAARESGRNEIDRLNRELRDSRKSIDELRAKLAAGVSGKEAAALRAELEKAGGELAAARESGRDELDRLNRELRDSRKSIDELKAQLAAGVSESGAANEASATELARLKADLAAAVTSLAEARNANAMLETARERLAETLSATGEAAANREKELRRIIARFEAGQQPPSPASPDAGAEDPGEKGETSSAVSGGAGGVELAEWKRKAQDLEKQLADALAATAGTEKDFAEWKSRAEAGAQAAADAWQSRVDAMQKEFDSLLHRSRTVSQAADAAWRDRLAKAEKDAADTLAAAKKTAADNLQQTEARLIRRLDQEKDAYAGHLDAVRKGFAADRAKLEAEKAAIEKEFAEVRRYAGLDAESFALNRTGRSVGKIVERLADGQILMITGGINQRVKAGMKFDVYRQTGDRSRHLGTVKVIRPLDDFSMVVSSYDDAEVMVCPITGRAVLEPGVRFSPYALGRDGKPVELKKAVAVGLPLEAPAIGDFVDNPFYDPERRLIIAVPDDLAGDSCVIGAVEDLGASPRTGAPGDADYILTRDDASAPAGDGPRRVSLGHLAKYLDPKPVFQQ